MPGGIGVDACCVDVDVDDVVEKALVLPMLLLDDDITNIKKHKRRLIRVAIIIITCAAPNKDEVSA